jgi:riboflavin kinase / FMN adenylyltransferase
MIRLDGNEIVTAPYRGAVVALGNFDGFHAGHQAVVQHAIERAKALGCPAIVATFDPHPVRHFRPDAAPFRLTTLNQRQRLFASAGADAMLVFHFDGVLAAVSAEDFITKLLVERVGAVGVVTGEDFTFGTGKSGNVTVLKNVGAVHGLICDSVGAIADEGGTISSSRIRAALESGDCATATHLLTRPFAIEGVVQHGDKNGRLLGFPTANIDVGPYLRPRYGIYAVKGRLADGRVLNGVANLGIRPSFDPPKELLEPYFFDFSEDLYGQTIEVEFHAFIRPEQKFDNLEALKVQMARDCDTARDLLKI